MPRSILPGLPREFTQLLEKDPTGRKDVSMSFMPPFDLQPSRFAHLAPVAVGYSMWEKSLLIRDNMHGHGGWDADVIRSGRWWSAPPDREGHRRSLDLMMVTCPMN